VALAHGIAPVPVRGSRSFARPFAEAAVPLPRLRLAWLATDVARPFVEGDRGRADQRAVKGSEVGSNPLEFICRTSMQ